MIFKHLYQNCVCRRQTSRGHDKKVSTSLSDPPGGASLCHVAGSVQELRLWPLPVTIAIRVWPSLTLPSLVASVVLLAVFRVIDQLEVIQPLLALPGHVEVEDVHHHLHLHHVHVALAVAVGLHDDTHLHLEAEEVIVETVDKW